MRPIVLFVGTGNSCRSQMAEAILSRQAAGSVDVFSAGLGPQAIHPLTLRVLSERGFDISSLVSKSIYDLMGAIRPDYLITLCESSRQGCPIVWPANTIWLHWPFEDPSRTPDDIDDQLQSFYRTYDDISLRICAWLLTRPFDQASLSRSTQRTGDPNRASEAFL